MTTADWICTECDQTLFRTEKRNFLGFPRYRCSGCAKDRLGPLSGGYRAAYVFFLLMNTALSAWLVFDSSMGARSTVRSIFLNLVLVGVLIADLQIRGSLGTRDRS